MVLPPFLNCHTFCVGFFPTLYSTLLFCLKHIFFSGKTKKSKELGYSGSKDTTYSGRKEASDSG
jgi:hypothetical protein